MLERCTLNNFSRILLEEDDDHTDDDDDDDGDGDADDVGDHDDNDPVELFQKQGKWWELIVNIPPIKMVIWRLVYYNHKLTIINLVEHFTSNLITIN